MSRRAVALGVLGAVLGVLLFWLFATPLQEAHTRYHDYYYRLRWQDVDGDRCYYRQVAPEQLFCVTHPEPRP